MRRKDVFMLIMTGLILGMISVPVSLGRATSASAILKAVTLSEPAASGDELVLRISGEYSFETIQATGDTVLLDLRGVRAGGVASASHRSGGIVVGYRLLPYTDAAGRPVVRVQVQLKQPEPLSVHQEPAGLRLAFGAGRSERSSSVAVGPAQPASSVAAPPVAVTRTKPVVAPNGPAEVSGISIGPGASGETRVDVATGRPTPYRVLRLQNPGRLVVDLNEARAALRQRSYSAQSPLLQGVRVGQFRETAPAVVRVVADLIGDPAIDVHAYPGGVRIELRSRVPASSPAMAAAPAAVRAAKGEEKAILDAGSTASPALMVERAEPVLASAQPQSATPVVAEAKPAPTSAPLDFQSALPAPAGSKEVAAAPRPESRAETPEALQAARAAQVMAGSSAVVSAAPQQQTPTPAGPTEEQPKYTGEPISLNLKDVDLKDFFRLIHEISGLNIIIDPNVAGSVTLVLDSVPWDQALDIVLKNNRLGKTLEGNVLRIARIETLTAEQEAAAKLVAAREDAAPLVTIFRPINYAKASTIATMLKAWVGGGALSRRGNVLLDDRTNTLIISDIQSQIPIVESIITKLDKKAKQVQIEARIVRATADFTRTLATALSAAYGNRTGSTIMAGSTAGSTTAGVVGTTTGTTPLVTTGSASGFGVYSISNAGARYIINAAIAAGETRSQVKTLSKPTIVTQNNVAGTVMQGTQIPIQTTINNTISITYVNATLTLTVTPQVTEDGNIFLVVTVTNNSPGAILTLAGPSINTQSANTQVLVPDGGTVVFGGVTVTTRSKSSTQVPLLGSIPILGHLFKSSRVDDSDQELLFFVSPKVLPG